MAYGFVVGVVGNLMLEKAETKKAKRVATGLVGYVRHKVAA